VTLSSDSTALRFACCRMSGPWTLKCGSIPVSFQALLA
jgi:hypothetical protein